MPSQTQHSPVKTSKLTDKCPMTGANLQAWVSVYDKVKKRHLLKLSIISLLSSGAIELSILSKHYQAEIAVVDTESGRVDRFGKAYNNLLHRCHSCDFPY